MAKKQSSPALKVQENIGYKIFVICNAILMILICIATLFPFLYLVKELGLDYYAAFSGCSSNVEASLATIHFLVTKVEEEGIPAVLYIEFSNQKMADVICEDTGCRKLLFHSCHSVTPAQFREGVSCLELMLVSPLITPTHLSPRRLLTLAIVSLKKEYIMTFLPTSDACSRSSKSLMHFEDWVRSS